MAFGSVRSSAVQKNQINYTDLFFGYDSYYLGHTWNDWLHLYASENSDLMNEIFNAYLDTGVFGITSMHLREGINSAADLVGFAKLIAGMVNPDYAYENSLDKANEVFAKNLVSDSALEGFSSDSALSKKILKRFKLVFSAYSKTKKELESGYFPEGDILKEYKKILKSEKALQNLSEEQISILFDWQRYDRFSEALDAASKLLEASAAMSVAMIIEDIRMEMINSIISNTTEGSFINDGMKRLKGQLQRGWVSYFVENYFKDMVLEEIAGELLKESIGSVFPPYLIASTIVKVASWVVFDVIFNVPSLEDCLTQQVYYNYTNNLSNALKNKRNVFNNQFISNDIVEYEDLFAALMAAVDAGLDATEKLEISSNRHSVENIRIAYQSFNYEAYIDSVKTTISLVSPDEVRYRPTDKGWNLPASTKFLAASDEAEPNAVYTFNGAIQGNVTLTGNGPLLTDCDPLVVNGSITANCLELNGHHLKATGSIQTQRFISSNGTITSDGTFTVTENSTIIGEDNVINCAANLGKATFNEGSLIANKDLTMQYIIMEHDNDYLLVNGNFTVSGSGYSKLTAGTVELKGNFTQSMDGGSGYNETEAHKTIFSGDEEQIVYFRYPSWNGFENLVLTNTNIKFATPFNHLKLCQDTVITNDQPLSIYNCLDLNGYTLSVKSSVETPTVSPSSGTITTGGGLKVTGYFSFDDNSIIVNGDLTTNYIVMTHEDDYLLVNGNFTVGGSGYSKLTAGTVELKGNFTQSMDGGSGYNETEAHKTIFSGDEEQIVYFRYPSWNGFENLVLTNTNIKFATPFNHLKLCQDTVITNDQPLSIYATIDLNGYQLTTTANINTANFNSSNGTITSDGSFTVTGNSTIAGENNIINCAANLGRAMFNEGSLIANKDLTMQYIIMEHDNDYLLVNGNFTVSGSGYSKLTAGTVELKGNFTQSMDGGSGYNETEAHKTIFSGDEEQIVYFRYPSGNGFSMLISLNGSDKGITFISAVRVTTLFNHNQNNFTLYNKGSGSTFVDYDGDGLKDNVDPYPTLKPGSADDFVIDEIEPQVFAGNPVTVIIAVICQEETLVEGKHYTVEYMNNSKPGTATVIIMGIDNFTGSVSKDFTIYCDHVYTPAVTKKATCTQAGVRTFTCFCGDSYTETIPVVAHTPGQWIAVQTATTQEEGRMEQRCTVCNTLLNSRKIDRLSQKAVEIAGIEGTTERTVDYKTTITFHSDLDTSVEDGEVHWYVNGKDCGQGKAFTVDEATSTYTVQSKVIKDGVVIAESSIETVKVKSNFLQRIIAFIKRIFNRKAFFIDQR